MQQVWEGGLHASSDALVPSKSYWYLASFKWSKDCWSHHTTAKTPGDLTMYDPNCQCVILTWLESLEAQETLGIFLSMDGNQQSEFTKLQQIAN